MHIFKIFRGIIIFVMQKCASIFSFRKERSVKVFSFIVYFGKRFFVIQWTETIFLIFRFYRIGIPVFLLKVYCIILLFYWFRFYIWLCDNLGTLILRNLIKHILLLVCRNRIYYFFCSRGILILLAKRLTSRFWIYLLTKLGLKGTALYL